MAAVLYALFTDPGAAEAAEAEVRALPSDAGPRAAHLFTRAPIDGNALPDSATSYGRNLVIAMIAGAAFMALAGGIAGALDLMLGMDVVMGVGLGLVTGLLMGLVGAMQAGTRIAKPALRDLEPRLREGAALLVVEAERDEVDAILEAMQRHGPEATGTLGSW